MAVWLPGTCEEGCAECSGSVSGFRPLPCVPSVPTPGQATFTSPRYSPPRTFQERRRICSLSLLAGDPLGFSIPRRMKPVLIPTAHKAL